MEYNSGIKISASKAIRYMQLRLSAEQISLSDVQKRTFEDTEKMIEHMRIRLNVASHLRHSNVLSP
jgi:hypothetical protein